MTWIIAYACKGIGHFLACHNQSRGWVKLKAPNSKGQGKGAAVDPMISPIPASHALRIWSEHYPVMLWVLKWSKKSCKGQACSVLLYHMNLLGQKVPSLLDSGSMVTLICEGYFTKNIQPLLGKSSGKLAKAHSMFQLSATNNEVMPFSKYFWGWCNSFGFQNSMGGIPGSKSIPMYFLNLSTVPNYWGLSGVTWSGLGARNLGGHMGSMLLRSSAVQMVFTQSFSHSYVLIITKVNCWIVPKLR